MEAAIMEEGMYALFKMGKLEIEATLRKVTVLILLSETHFF